MIAALYVDPGGVYAGLPDVEVWDEERDARGYAGPWRVVAHPPCSSWSKYWFRVKDGDDGGCFASALAAVRRWGGVLEHPAYSHAWQEHGLPWPPSGGWQRDIHGGWCCQVEQGWYGHPARKPTWLYAVSDYLPDLKWGRSPQRLHPRAVELHGYVKARRQGMMAWVGNGQSLRGLREATPLAFRDVLLGMARAA